MKLNELSAGSVFSKNGMEFVVIKQELNQSTVVTKNIYLSREFDRETPHWADASIRAFMNTDILHDMESVFGSSNIFYSETDMTSLDGRTYYGKCMDKIRLMTVEEIKQNPNLPNDTGDWELTVTPWTVSEVGGEYVLCLVAYRGYIRNYDCRNMGAIRPCMNVNSDIEV